MPDLGSVDSIAQHVEKTVAELPPPTPAQRDGIAALLAAIYGRNARGQS